MSKTTYREAMKQAIRDALKRDPRIFVMGEDVGRYGGCYAVTKGLLQEFGEERIRDTPLSESAFVGAGIGAAMAGMRPIVEIMTVNFSLLALDQIVNNAATIPHMSGGQFAVPLVIRMATGAGRQLAAQHSHSLEGWYAHIPGLKILAPATLEDARGMLWTALQDPNPVLIFEHVNLYNMEGELADDAGPVPIEGAAVRRAGRDLSIVTYGASLHKSLAAAEQLAAEGIEAEVIDLRSLRPLDDATIMASVSRTRRVLIVDEGSQPVDREAGGVQPLEVPQVHREHDQPQVAGLRERAGVGHHLVAALRVEPERVGRHHQVDTGPRGAADQLDVGLDGRLGRLQDRQRVAAPDYVDLRRCALVGGDGRVAAGRVVDAPGLLGGGGGLCRGGGRGLADGLLRGAAVVRGVELVGLDLHLGGVDHHVHHGAAVGVHFLGRESHFEDLRHRLLLRLGLVLVQFARLLDEHGAVGGLLDAQLHALVHAELGAQVDEL